MEYIWALTVIAAISSGILTGILIDYFLGKKFPHFQHVISLIVGSGLGLVIGYIAEKALRG